MNVKDNIAEEFNAFSKNYTEDMIRCVPYYQELLSHFSKQFPENFQPQSILDLGCGNGNVTNALFSLFSKAKYTLVDASQDMLDLCGIRFKKYDIDYCNSYFNDFTFKPNSFDLVVAGFSLHHCLKMDKPLIYKKIYQALKPNGIFACSDLMIDKKEKEHKKHLMDWEAFVFKSFPDGEKWTWIKEHYDQFDNPDSISNHLHWLKKAGFNHFNFNAYDNFWTHFKAIKA